MSAVNTVKKGSKIVEAVNAPAPDENVEIVFDFDQADLFDILEVMEYSAEMFAKSQSGEEPQNDPAKYAKFLRVLRQTYVSSSRPLKGSDYLALTKTFWQSLNLSKDPNS